MLVLKNEKECYVRYEYGEDLFGDMYLDIVQSKRELCRQIIKYNFKKKTHFIQFLDYDLLNKESHHYTIIEST